MFSRLRPTSPTGRGGCRIIIPGGRPGCGSPRAPPPGSSEHDRRPDARGGRALHGTEEVESTGGRDNYPSLAGGSSRWTWAALDFDPCLGGGLRVNFHQVIGRILSDILVRVAQQPDHAGNRLLLLLWERRPPLSNEMRGFAAHDRESVR